MPNNIERGKAGTLTAEDFESLTSMSSQYSPKLLASKVAKYCTKRAEDYLHEYSASMVGTALKNTATKISTAVGSAEGVINRDSYKMLTGMVDRYGAEIVVRKLGKIARRSGDRSSGLADIFPRSAS